MQNAVQTINMHRYWKFENFARIIISAPSKLERQPSRWGKRSLKSLARHQDVCRPEIISEIKKIAELLRLRRSLGIDPTGRQGKKGREG